jgi:hypothetical protein
MGKTLWSVSARSTTGTALERLRLEPADRKRRLEEVIGHPEFEDGKAEIRR